MCTHMSITHSTNIIYFVFWSRDKGTYQSFDISIYPMTFLKIHYLVHHKIYLKMAFLRF